MYRISLPHAALSATNAYLIEDEQCVLIDGGHTFAAAQDLLAVALGALSPGQKPSLLCLTDGMPDRAGYPLTPEGAQLAVAAHPALQRPAADFAAFSLRYRRELVLPVFEDAHVYRRFELEALQTAVNRTYSAAGKFQVHEQGVAGTVWRLGRRKLHAIPAPGPSATHVAYWLEPDEILFSGDIGYAQGLELPPLLGGLGADMHGLIQTTRALSTLPAQRILPATGEPFLDSEALLERTCKGAEQFLSNVCGLVCGGPRELATLLDLVSLGQGLSPIRLAHRLAALRVALATLVTAGEIEELYDERVYAYRLSEKALHARRAA